MNTHSETKTHQSYRFLCPQCGCPTHGSPTSSGQQSSFCEDCVGDRDIDDADMALSG